MSVLLKHSLLAMLMAFGSITWAADCDPEPFGPGTHFTVVTSIAGGIGSSWVCTVNGEPRVQQPIVMRTGYVPPAGCASSVAGIVMDMKNSGANALLAKCSAPWPAAELPIRDAIADQVRISVSAKWNRDHPPVVTPPPPPPTPKVCTVSPNPPYLSRQWYSLVNGVRSKSGGGSVTIAGTACKLDVASVLEGAVQYGAFGPTFRTDRVTVCSCQ